VRIEDGQIEEVVLLDVGLGRTIERRRDGVHRANEEGVVGYSGVVGCSDAAAGGRKAVVVGLGEKQSGLALRTDDGGDTDHNDTLAAVPDAAEMAAPGAAEVALAAAESDGVANDSQKEAIVAVPPCTSSYEAIPSCYRPWNTATFGFAPWKQQH